MKHETIMRYNDYCVRGGKLGFDDWYRKPGGIRRKKKKEEPAWPTHNRMDPIGQNGNTGEHYGLKDDGQKPRYDLLPAKAIDYMAQVMTFGADKYGPDNWRGVENAQARYQAAMLRHAFAMQRGEVNDPETGLPHAAHVMCCAAFLCEVGNE